MSKFSLISSSISDSTVHGSGVIKVDPRTIEFELKQLGLANSTCDRIISDLKGIGATIDKVSISVSVQGTFAFFNNFNDYELPVHIRKELRSHEKSKDISEDMKKLVYTVAIEISNESNSTSFGIGYKEIDEIKEIGMKGILFIQEAFFNNNTDFTNFYDTYFHSPITISYALKGIMKKEYYNNLHVATVDDPFITEKRDEIYSNFSISIGILIEGYFICDSNNIFSPFCKVIAQCNKENNSGCEKYLTSFKKACKNKLNTDDCFNFVQGYYSHSMNISSIDDYIKEYCKTKELTIFNPVNNEDTKNSKERERDIQLCGCHMKKKFYENFSKSIKEHASKNEYRIDKNLLEKRCLFPACTISPFPNQGTICDNSVCFDELEMDRDGNITKILFNKNCIIDENKSTNNRFLNILIKILKYTERDIIVFVTITVIIILLISILKTS
jgi:hypothetical protein